jgi:hypothetical protein
MYWKGQGIFLYDMNLEYDDRRQSKERGMHFYIAIYLVALILPLSQGGL